MVKEKEYEILELRVVYDYSTKHRGHAVVSGFGFRIGLRPAAIAIGKTQYARLGKTCWPRTPTQRYRRGPDSFYHTPVDFQLKFHNRYPVDGRLVRIRSGDE